MLLRLCWWQCTFWFFLNVNSLPRIYFDALFFLQDCIKADKVYTEAESGYSTTTDTPDIVVEPPTPTATTNHIEQKMSEISIEEKDGGCAFYFSVMKVWTMHNISNLDQSIYILQRKRKKPRNPRSNLSCRSIQN